jgi:hypothetical protein
MLKLDGAEELRRLVLEKWSYAIVRKSNDPTSYVATFPCPVCSGDAYEFFLEVEPDPDDIAEWKIRWASDCGHVSGVGDDVACVCTQVEEDGVIVGTIEPVSPPEWPRYEGSGDTSVPDRPCACFGTLWQAMHASADECGLLAEIQAEDEKGEVAQI